MKKLSELGSQEEKVLFRGKVDKFNSRGTKKSRVLVITDLGVYNYKGIFYKTCKRRIDVILIDRILRSRFSHEFILCIPQEYDYHYQSVQASEICDVIVGAHHTISGNTISIEFKVPKSLREYVVTKHQSRINNKKLLEEKLHTINSASTQSSPKDSMVLSNSSNQQAPRLPHQMESMTQMVYSIDKEEVNLGSFKILSIIGKGTYGMVYMVRKQTTGDIFAMKVLSKADIVSEKQLEHTKAEYEILEAVQHPYIVSLHYAFQTATRLYLVLDYLNGGELFFHLKQAKTFNEERARFYAAEVLLAIGHLHSLGIVYRDLKPENILLDASGHIRLTDFGLAKRSIKDNKSASTLCGTPEYMAPEILKQSGHGRAVDWWSLGTMIYEMLIGMPPFYHQNTKIMFEKTLYSKLVFHAEISPTAKDLITKMLEKDPEERLGSGPKDAQEIMDHHFFSWMDWNALFRREISPPFIPHVKSVDDVGNFDSSITSEPVDQLILNANSSEAAAVLAFNDFDLDVKPKNILGTQPKLPPKQE